MESACAAVEGFCACAKGFCGAKDRAERALKARFSDVGWACGGICCGKKS